MPESAAYVYVGALVDELARAGVADLVLCPGSRSTPVAMSAARHPGVRVWTLIDERSAAFFALGLARGRRRPVALLATSGTAAANFLPGIVEARYGRVPLVVLTADRPHELRDSGAPQTIDQIRLYGTHVKWAVDLALPEASEALLRYVRTVAGQAAAIAAEEPAGAVHLNIPLREPLVPLPGDLPPAESRGGDAWEGRSEGRPYAAVAASRREPRPDAVAGLARALRGAARGVIVCGPADDPDLAPAVARLADSLGYPVLADPLSQVRCGPHDRRNIIDVYDAMLRVEALAVRLEPDVILRVGATPASRPLAQYVQEHARARQVVVDPSGWTDPARVAGEFVRADPVVVCERLADAAGGAEPADPAWLSTWQRLALVTRQSLVEGLAEIEEPFEGRVFFELAQMLPDGAVLYAGNSMPVRDLDSFFPGGAVRLRMLGNRGASGIDGLVSSALGVSASGAEPVVLVLGDLAFYHDMNGLLAAKLHGLSATIVLLNNDGGGIFSFLPQAAYPEHFEALFGTPAGLAYSHAAALYGATFARAGTWPQFRAQVERALASRGLSIVEVRTDRTRNVALHRQVWARVDAALRGEVPLAGAGRIG